MNDYKINFRAILHKQLKIWKNRVKTIEFINEAFGKIVLFRSTVVFLFIIRKWGPRGSQCLKGSKRDPFVENKVLERHVQRDPNDFTSESSKGVCLKTTARLNLKRQVLNRINPNGFSINDLLNKKNSKICLCLSCSQK